MRALLMPVEWQLKETLEREGVSVYALAEQMGGASRRPALYAITSPDLGKRPRRVSFDLLEDVVTALYALTGKRYKVGDLLEFNPDPVPLFPDAPPPSSSAPSAEGKERQDPERQDPEQAATSPEQDAEAEA